jgi:hypothetical protein
VHQDGRHFQKVLAKTGTKTKINEIRKYFELSIHPMKPSVDFSIGERVSLSIIVISNTALQTRKVVNHP